MFCARSMRTASSLSSFATHDAIFTAYPDGYRRVESNIDGLWSERAQTGGGGFVVRAMGTINLDLTHINWLHYFDLVLGSIRWCRGEGCSWGSCWLSSPASVSIFGFGRSTVTTSPLATTETPFGLNPSSPPPPQPASPFLLLSGVCFSIGFQFLWCNCYK